MLTAKGDNLVASVVATLEELGFDVTCVDPTLDAKAAKREDLRVRDGDWVALVEVRGYSKGAQLNDLLRLERFVGLYVAESGNRPDGVWYVVNQMVGDNPSLRPLALGSHPLEVQTFGEGNGLVIDTRDLFRLLMSVHSGVLAPDTARGLLRSADGLFSYHGPESGFRDDDGGEE